MLVSFFCKTCDKTFTKSLSKPQKEFLCEDCNSQAKRAFKAPEVEIVEDHIIMATNAMLYGTLPSGKDKVVF